MLVWIILRARSASRSSMTQEMLISLAPAGGKKGCQISLQHFRGREKKNIKKKGKREG